MQVQLPVWLPLVGRILFASYFLAMGISHLLHFQDHAAFIGGKGRPACAARDHPDNPHDGGGRSILTMFNWHRSLGAVLLFGIIFPAPFFLHHFWNETDSYTRLSEFAHFIKDLSLSGAALLLLS